MGIRIGKECIGCEICQEACPYSSIEIIEGLAQVTGHCTYCGACQEVCPENAIVIDRPAESKDDMSFKDWQGIWVFTEARDGQISSVSYELLTKARKLADILKTDLSSILLSGTNVDINELEEYGPDLIYRIIHSGLKDALVEPYAKVLVDLTRELKPEIILAGATSFGRSLMPSVAATLKTGLTADCTGLEIDKEKRFLKQTRPTFGGNLMATIICPDRRPQMATVRPHVFKRQKHIAEKKAQVVDKSYAGDLSSRIKMIEKVTEFAANEKLEDADVIIAAGRGLKKEEDLKMVDDLAKLLNGAVGASRGLVDEGLMSYAHQVGQTGKTVCPKLYVACGISGAIQHLAGMQTSETIVAINKDPDAPIFQVADYGIVGDVKEVLPLLVKGIKEEFGQCQE